MCAVYIVIDKMIFILFGLLFGFVGYKLAEKKGYDPTTAFFACFFTGILGLFAYLVCKDKGKN